MKLLRLKKTTAAGEPWVWLTAMGMGVGLFMVLSLLVVIIVNGTRAFYPQKIAELTLQAGVTQGPLGATRFAGAIILQQEKKDKTQPGQEWQVFVGNRDVYGESFYFIDESAIAVLSHPKDLLIMERLEYGDAIGTPMRLRLKDGIVWQATQEGFEKKLQAVVTTGVERWAEIQKIEKIDIGAINKKMEELKYESVRLEKSNPSNLSERLATLDAKQVKLQAEYEILATKTRELRKQQEENSFVYQLPTGEERSIATGKILHFYFPNRLSSLARVGLLIRNAWHFLKEEPREANTEGGIFPAIFGTLVMTVLMSLAVTPFGVMAAIYLREYARQNLWTRAVRIAVNNLAGVPSIVFGVFGLGFFVYGVGGSIDALFFSEKLPNPTFGTGGILWASLTLALMTVPVVIVATEEALAAVLHSMREASLACGASQWQTIQRIVLPAAAPGILTGVILAMARGAGEVAPLMLVGVVKLAPELPLNLIPPFIHLDQKFMHLGFHIYDLGFQSPDSEAAKPMVFATTLFLLMLIFALNLGAVWIRERLRRRYASGNF